MFIQFLKNGLVMKLELSTKKGYVVLRMNF